MISTVTLPLVKADETVREALSRLRASKTSAIVVLDKRGPVVVSDKSVVNTLRLAGEKGNPLASTITAHAFDRKGWLRSPSILAMDQDKYAVTKWTNTTADVMTDEALAADLLKESDVLDMVK